MSIRVGLRPMARILGKIPYLKFLIDAGVGVYGDTNSEVGISVYGETRSQIGVSVEVGYAAMFLYMGGVDVYAEPSSVAGVSVEMGTP